MPETVETIPPGGVGPDEKSDSKKRPNENSNKKQKNNRSNKRNKKDKKNHTWRPENGDAAGDPGKLPKKIGIQKKEVHAGSFANPAMREMFAVTLPPHLIPPTSTEREEIIEENKGDNESRNFVKRKVAFLLAYLGTGYSGFQANEGQRTLQADFELALLKGGFLNPLNVGFYYKYGWSTSGRTDKGVHACGQVCSAKIQILPDQTLDDVREIVNQHLPDNFRVLDVVKTSKAFCAKTSRGRVRYQYMIPAFCFWDRNELKELMNKVAPFKKEGRSPGLPMSEAELSEMKELVKDYRVSPEQLEALQKALDQYKGTHSFHNFTNKLTAKDPSAMRYIVSFNVEEPMVFENGMQWIPTQVIGQSFLIHQIRKMVSVAVDSVRLGIPNLIPNALDKQRKMRTDLAPAQGLFLEMSFYDNYNERLMPEQKQIGVEELNWHEEETEAYKRWKKFRNEVLMNHIVKEEDQEGNFLQHLYNHEFYFDHSSHYDMAKEDEGASAKNGTMEKEAGTEEAANETKE